MEIVTNKSISWRYIKIIVATICLIMASTTVFCQKPPFFTLSNSQLIPSTVFVNGKPSITNTYGSIVFKNHEQDVDTIMFWHYRSVMVMLKDDLKKIEDYRNVDSTPVLISLTLKSPVYGRTSMSWDTMCIEGVFRMRDIRLTPEPSIPTPCLQFTVTTLDKHYYRMTLSGNFPQTVYKQTSNKNAKRWKRRVDKKHKKIYGDYPIGYYPPLWK